MRLQSIVLLALFALITQLVAAQDADLPTFMVGPELAEQKNNRIWKTFGHSDQFFYCLRTDRRKEDLFILEKIGVDSLSVLKTSEFSLGEINTRIPVFAYPFSTDDASFIIATAEDPESKDIFILAYRIFDNLTIAIEPVVIGIANREALMSEDGFLIFRSKDKKKVALFIPEEKDQLRTEKFALRYFDSELNLLESRKIEIPYPSDEVRLEDALLTPDGVFHGIISLSKATEVRVLPNSYALLTYNPAEDKIKEKSLALKSKWIYDLKLTLTPDTNLWLAGYYSNMMEPSMAGTFSVLIEANSGELLNTGLSPFDRDFRLMFRSNLKNNEDELGLFQLDNLTLNGDGSLSMISEKRFDRQSTIFNPATGTYTVIQVHNYEELLITTILPGSQIVETLLIPKYQSSSRNADRYTSYAKTIVGDQLLFLYNDHIRNEPLSSTQFDEYRTLNNSNNMSISYGLIRNGEIIKKTLNPPTLDSYHLDAEQQYRSSKGHVFTTYNGYRTRYIKVLTP